MRQCTAALTSYIADSSNRGVIVNDLFTISLVGGGIFRFTGGTYPLVTNSSFFPGSPLNGSGGALTFGTGPLFGPTKAKFKVGVEGQTIDLTIAPNSGDTIGTLPWAQAARVGVFDFAWVEVNRYFFPANAPTDLTLGGICWWYGQVADIDMGRTHISMRIGNVLNILKSRQMPRRLYQSTCNHVFGGTMCGYDRVLGKNALGVSTGVGRQTVTAAGGSSQSSIVLVTPPTGAANYLVGSIIGLTGPNAGFSRTISTSGGTITTYTPFLYPVSAGNTFYVLPGCPHTLTFCGATLQNLLRYGGFVYIPPPEFAF